MHKHLFFLPSATMILQWPVTLSSLRLGHDVPDRCAIQAPWSAVFGPLITRWFDYAKNGFGLGPDICGDH